MTTPPLQLIKESDNLTGYSKKSWLEDASRHLTSALLLRATRHRRRGMVQREPDARKRLKHIQTMNACVLSSNLLVAYAVELALKGGLTAVYANCSHELFSEEVKLRFGHNLIRIAKEIDFPLAAAARKELKYLERIIRDEGRYPPFAESRLSAVDAYNTRANRLWDDPGFRKRVALFKVVEKHVKQ